jgi:P pilus assembly chaperone PapD
MRAACLFAALLALASLIGSGPVRAELALDSVIVDFTSGAVPRADIEVANTDTEETLFVSIEPVEIVDPGSPEQRRVARADPRELGLLVSPNRLILEPGQRKLVRLSLLGRPVDRDRIYRVTVKPVVGELEADTSALKIVVGYDVLVIARPAGAQPQLQASRDGRRLAIRNAGNTNALLFDGRQCAAAPTDDGGCAPLPSRRLYAGNRWEVDLPAEAPAEYLIEADGRTERRSF